MGTLRRRRRRRDLGNKELAAEEEILEDLFYDIYRHRGRVYRTNFFRGIFFGFGLVIGSTIIVAIVVAILSLMVTIPGGLGDFFNWVIETIRNRYV